MGRPGGGAREPQEGAHQNRDHSCAEGAATSYGRLRNSTMPPVVEANMSVVGRWFTHRGSVCLLPDCQRHESQTAIERSASPAAVSVALDRLSDAVPGLQARLAGDHALRDAVFAVTAASRSLTELLLSEPAALELLANLDQRPVPDEDDGRGTACAWWMAARAPAHRRPRSLPASTTCRWRVGAGRAGRRGAPGRGPDGGGLHPGLAVIGMGKLGRELNYLSDIDIMFVGDPHVHDRTAWATHPRHRPHLLPGRCRPPARGSGRPPVRSLESYEAYWSGGPTPGSSRPCSRPGPSPATPTWARRSSNGPRAGCGTVPSPSTTCGRCGP